jgi:peptidoglycan/xylan/chitin deacetylase (PgdA/CDA1 family)
VVTTPHELEDAVTRRDDRRGGDVLVLEYHAVSETWPADLAVTPLDFRRQLEWLVERGYRSATFHDAVTFSPSPRTLVVTFDDAYVSVLELAYPILSSLGLPATVFVVTDFAEGTRPLEWPGIDHWRGGPHEHELRGLAWPQLAHLAESGWEVGSHTRTHARLTQLSDEALARELRESREASERSLRRPCRSLAYPYGDYDRRVMAAAADAGYEVAAIEDVARPAALAWPRVGIYRPNSMRVFRLKVAPWLRSVRAATHRLRRGSTPGTE